MLRAHPPFTLEKYTHKKSSFAMQRETHPLSLGPLFLLFPLVQLQALLSHSPSPKLVCHLVVIFSSVLLFSGMSLFWLAPKCVSSLLPLWPLWPLWAIKGLGDFRAPKGWTGHLIPHG